MKKDKPIITTLLDTDLYKLAMMYTMWKLGIGNNHVTYTFQNRSTVPLGNILVRSEVEEQLDELFNLDFSFTDLKFLHDSKMYPDDFLNYLASFPRSEYTLSFRGDGTKDYHINGLWQSAVLYETASLAIFNELYTEKFESFGIEVKKENHRRIIYNLEKKCECLANSPFCEEIKFIELGTRRRSSSYNQLYVIDRLLEQFPNMMGTSNIDIARKLGIPCKGTTAHEWFQCYAAKGFYTISLQESQIKAIQDWLKINYSMYALTDTYGTDFFLNEVASHQDIVGKINFRQDSGNPINILKKYVAYFNKYNISKDNRKVICSDGLNVFKILEIHNEFHNDLNLSYGWGTDLSNDGLIAPLPLVIKLSSVSNITTVKLSDTPDKHFGDPNKIEMYKYAACNYPKENNN